MGVIAVQDLRVRCIVGVNPHERKIEQDLFVDLRIETDFSEAARTDRLRHTVDYTAMTVLLTDWMRREKFKLIETLAERACALLCAEWPQIRRCRVTIKKPGALPQARHAAVTAERISTPAGSASGGKGEGAGGRPLRTGKAPAGGGVARGRRKVDGKAGSR
jgi:dihydroneopterin aldolase